MWPTLIELHGYRIHSFSTLFSLGFAVATVLARRRARAAGLDQARVLDLLILMVTAGVVGARACYVIEAWPTFEGRWMEALQPWRGGLSFYGGLIGCLTAGAVYCHLFDLPLPVVCDVLVPCAALGHAFGRIGCLLHGCCFGRLTGTDWGLAFPGATGDGALRHPTQGYEALGLILIFALLSGPVRALGRGRPAGLVTAAYLMMYGSLRFTLETLRADVTGGARLGLLPYQWVSLAMFVLGAAVAAGRGVQGRSIRSAPGLATCA